MSMPGYTSEASLYISEIVYSTIGVFNRSGGAVRPQSCDWDCLDGCQNACPDLGDCAAGPAGAACRRAIIPCRRECFRECCQ
jgi:hypothetical protein